jgi:hypothetical protein
VRVSARMTGAALVVTAALALTGCNGSTGSSHSHGKKHKSSSSSHKSSSSTHKSSSAGGASVSTSAIKDVWKHGEVPDADYVHLMLLDQDNGVVVTTLKASCTGTFEDIGRYVAIHTTCKKGHGYESGTIKSLKNGKLTVAWEGGTTQQFVRDEDM